MAGMLYLVPTPIGNLDDITLRAVRVLREVDLILAEDTRTSSVLLRHLGIEKRLHAHHKFNEHATVKMVAGSIAAGRNAACSRCQAASTRPIPQAQTAFCGTAERVPCVLLRTCLARWACAGRAQRR